MGKLESLLLAATLAASGVSRAEAPPSTRDSNPSPEPPEHCKNVLAARIDCSPTVSAAFDGRGNLWLAWTDLKYVYVQKSADRGGAFGRPVRVNRDPEAIAAHGESRPKIALGPEGHVYLTWVRNLGPRFTSHILFSRSTDGGRTFSAPRVVNDNRDVIGHAFDSLAVGRDGKVFIAWLDGRDSDRAKKEGRSFTGSSLYYTWSDDGGRTFRPDKLAAPGTCQCCRLQTVLDESGLPAVMWRHIFPDGIRDHALLRFRDWDTPGEVVRASFENWKIDACPHHGPGLAVDALGGFHAVWFSNAPGNSGLFYAFGGPEGRFAAPLRFGGPGAGHPHLTVGNGRVVVVWSEFDGHQNVVYAMTSSNRGASFTEARAVARAEGTADHPFLLRDGDSFYLSWQTRAGGYRWVRVE